MKRFRLYLLAIAIALVPVMAQAAGTVVCTSSDVQGQSVWIYTCTMTADAATGSYPATATTPINGWIISAETNPGSTGPTAAYDITLLDSDGVDVMAGGLNNRSATVSEKIITPQPYVYGPVTITTGNNSVNSAVVVLTLTVLR